MECYRRRNNAFAVILTGPTLFGVDKKGMLVPVTVRHGSYMSGAVDILAMLRNLQSRHLESRGAAIGQIDFGFEICSTGGQPETFSVSRYTLTAAAGK
jgi:hypothetical protein